MTSSQHGPYDLGYTRATMAGTTRSKHANASESLKAGPSSDRSLQLDSVKLESLVIAGQHTAVNTFPGLVHTARHTMGVGCS
jgi:ribosomal protein L19